eukprot:TRINITY_DN4538_c0_g3_i1.p1 TRINITY_DN4538_c0_g3~~TRINITY_DN4538_c0_g3_i1.p1  ORF type:complete len:223 (+),score=21.48 TRINITY_DN4538_c0_g3_i1:58-726(+)
MAFRTPVLTIVFLVITAGLYMAALWYDNWLGYEREVSADVGILQYKVTAALNVDTGSTWTFGMDCNKGLPESSDRSDCGTWKRVSISLSILIVIAFGFVCHGLYDCLFGSATQIRPFFASFIFGIAALILFLAAYERVRIPFNPYKYTSRSAHVLDMGGLSASLPDYIASNSTPNSVPEMHDGTPDLTFRPAFFLFALGSVSNLAGLFYHLCTCTRRKHEEL